MLARAILAIVGVISLLWIGYSTLELIDKQDQFNPSFVFNQEDGQIVIINPTNRIAYESLNLSINPEALKSIHALLISNPDVRIFISEKRNQFLIESSGYITEEVVRSYFSDSEIRKEKKELFLGGSKINMYKNWCLVKPESITTSKEPINDFEFDKNADISVVQINNKSLKVTDYYADSKGLVSYKQSFSKELFGKKINDQQLFSTITPSKIESYHFFERDYLRSLDTVFTNSPMDQWVKSGILKIELNNEEAVITDFITGQDPINVLNEHFNLPTQIQEGEKFPSIKLFGLINFNKGFYALTVDNFVVISASKSTCEQIISDYKLGLTLAQNTDVSNTFYGDLPVKVNERYITSHSALTKSVNEKQLNVVQRLGSVREIKKNAVASVESIEVGETIQDFLLLSKDKLVVLTASNKLSFYSKGVKQWEKELPNSSFFKLEAIDIFADNNQQIMVTSNRSIHLFEVNGAASNGFPILIESDNIATLPSFYRWKGSGFFMVPLENGQILQFDAKGREINLFKTKLTSIATPLAIWASAGRVFMGASDGETFTMIDIEKKREHRSFEAKGIAASVKIPNELLLFATSGDKFNKIDQKGELTEIKSVTNPKIVASNDIIANPIIALKEKNIITLFNHKGVEWAEIRVPFNEIDEVALHQLNKSKFIISVIDGLENNVYLYNSKGDKISNKNWEGSKKVTILSLEKSSFILATIVDNMIVLYQETTN